MNEREWKCPIIEMKLYAIEIICPRLLFWFASNGEITISCVNGCSDACPDYCKNPEKDSRLSERFTGLVNNIDVHIKMYL